MEKYIYFILMVMMTSSCYRAKKTQNSDSFEKGTFGYDLAYLSQKDAGLTVLSSDDGKTQIIVSAKYQGKVFTSTANGLSGASFGFVNYDALDSNIVDEHINAYGGENRFWLGPEGGRYSIYFTPDSEQVFDHWHTPKPFDVEAWDLVSSDKKNAVMNKKMQVTNYLGNQFNLNVERKISLLEPSEVNHILGIEANPDLNMTAYQTENIITNLNDFQWTEKTGTICIWMLDMFNPAPDAVTVIPFNDGDEALMGKIVTSDYFGEIPADRLKLLGNVIYLKTDGNYRSKLGLNGKRTKSIAGNYDTASKRLTITTFDVDPDAVYLNQEWNPAKDPLTGDALNAYNDGPLEDGSIMGPFLELESVSPAAFLKPAQSLMHRHLVFHFSGEEKDLNPISEKLLGVSTSKIKNVFQ